MVSLLINYFSEETSSETQPWLPSPTPSEVEAAGDAQRGLGFGFAAGVLPFPKGFQAPSHGHVTVPAPFERNL